MENERTAILLLAFGGPERLEDVEAFCRSMRGGQEPPPEMVERVAVRYRAIGQSPLNRITREQADSLALATGLPVYVGMKHGRPSISEAVRRLTGDGCERVVAIPLAPQYSRISIGGYRKAFGDALAELAGPLDAAFVDHWYDNHFLIDCISEQTREAHVPGTPVIFTAHSLPERIRSWQDPYEEQVTLTARLVAERLGIREWSVAFQSAGKNGEPWIGPDLIDTLGDIKKRGFSSALVCPVGFVADHMEILYDIDIECQAWARDNRFTLDRVASRNTHPLFIAALAEVAQKGLAEAQSEVLLATRPK